MGACFNYRKIEAKNSSEAKRAAELHQKAEQHEFGHGGYTGHLGTAGVGVQITERVFSTLDDATKWVDEHHNKWDLPYLLEVNGADGPFWVLAGWCSE